MTDESFRTSLIKHASKQIKNFSWDISAKKAIDAFEKATQGAISKKPMSHKRLKLAYISPLPPERSGISDYSVELLPELYNYYDIDVIVEQESISDAWVNEHCHVLNVASFKNNLHNYDRVLYHFGNSSFHQHMFNLLNKIPGVVILHDFYLSGISNYMYHTQYKNHSFDDDLYYAHGNAPFNHKDCDLTIEYPTNKKVLDDAQGIIVHSQNSVRLAKEWYGKLYGYDWSVIPLLRQPAQSLTKKKTRKSLNLPQDAFIIASFGLMGQTKLNQKLLDAWLDSSLAKDTNAYLLFVGENSVCEYGKTIESSIKNSPYSNRIIITGWTDTEVFRSYLSTADLAVQLRGLSRGETSAAALDCMNYGLPTIVNANGSMADLPQNAVYMIEDKFTKKDLTKALEELYRDEQKRKTLSKNAQRVIRKEHSPANCAMQYVHAIESFYHKEIIRKEGFIEFKVKANQLEIKANELKTKANELEAKANELETKANNLQQRNNLMMHSMSWKITKPYRYLGHKTKWLKGNTKAWITFAPTSRPRKVLKQRLINLKSYLNKNPKLKRKLLNVLEHMPNLKQRLQRVGEVKSDKTIHIDLLKSPADLSPDARTIHDQLITEIEKHTGNRN